MTLQLKLLDSGLQAVFLFPFRVCFGSLASTYLSHTRTHTRRLNTQPSFHTQTPAFLSFVAAILSLSGSLLSITESERLLSPLCSLSAQFLSFWVIDHLSILSCEPTLPTNILYHHKALRGLCIMHVCCCLLCYFFLYLVQKQISKGQYQSGFLNIGDQSEISSSLL